MSLNGMRHVESARCGVAAAEYHLGGSDASPKAICEWISSSSYQHSLSNWPQQSRDITRIRSRSHNGGQYCSTAGQALAHATQASLTAVPAALFEQMTGLCAELGVPHWQVMQEHFNTQAFTA